MLPINWLISLGASPVDVMIFIMGMLFAVYVIHRDKQRSKENESLWAEIKSMREEIKAVRDEYYRLDAASFGIGIAMQASTGIKLFKQSADGSGNYVLNRDIKNG